MDIREWIETGRASLGIEFGSTRIKAVLTGEHNEPVAVGVFDWHDELKDGYWTYPVSLIQQGLAGCYQSLKADVLSRYGLTLSRVRAMGVSAMMHGYLPFNRQGELLVPFRTWRNTTTGAAAAELSELLDFNIPQRWSIAHLHQAILNREPHVKDIALITTLAGYAHMLLTGERVLSVGDASGVFPFDSEHMTYDARRLAIYEKHVAGYGYPWALHELLPRPVNAGEQAGTLTEAGAALLDPAGDLKPGVPFCAPEGDAGTGMVATNSVRPSTGNISAGTSIFAMIVLEKSLSKPYPEVDMVTTPDGAPVAMVHCNTCTSDLNAWVGLLREALACFGVEPDTNTLYTRLFEEALQGAPDAGGLIDFNYFSGEPVTGTDQGVPLLTRRPDRPMHLRDMMRAQIYSALATLSIGMETLTEKEQVRVTQLVGHGGLFKTPVVGQRLMAAALHAPVTVMETAGEGGAWGIALLAAYMADHQAEQSLADWLKAKVFAEMPATTIQPEKTDEQGFAAWLKDYRALLPAEIAAARALMD